MNIYEMLGGANPSEPGAPEFSDVPLRSKIRVERVGRDPRPALRIGQDFTLSQVEPDIYYGDQENYDASYDLSLSLSPAPEPEPDIYYDVVPGYEEPVDVVTDIVPAPGGDGGNGGNGGVPDPDGIPPVEQPGGPPPAGGAPDPDPRDGSLDSETAAARSSRIPEPPPEPDGDVAAGSIVWYRKPGNLISISLLALVVAGGVAYYARQRTKK